MAAFQSGRLAGLLALSFTLQGSGCKPDQEDTGLTGDDAGDTAEPASLPAAVFGPPNVDDDDGNGQVDWYDRGPAGDDDRGYLDIDPSLGAASAELSGDTDLVRIWQGGEVILGEGASLDAMVGAGLLEVEFKTYLAEASLLVRDAAGAEIGRVRLLASPVVLHHHLEPVKTVWVMSVSYGMGYSNADMVADLSSIFGDALVTVPGQSYGYDVWLQDEIELTTIHGPDAPAELALDSIRSQNGRYLDAFSQQYLEGPGVAVITLGTGMPNSLDSFGNLETSPPVTVGGVHYPLGRTYYGGASGYQPARALTDFLGNQIVQDPIMVDSTWLCVGHVDEFVSFIPDPTAPQGFRVLWADTDLAWELIDDLPGEQRLSRYQVDHGYATVGALRSDNALRSLNTSIQRDHLDPLLEEFKREFGFTEEEVIRVPSLFEEPRFCGSTAAALIPGMVNLLVAEVDGSTHLVMADPFFRDTASQSQADDPLISYMMDVLPASSEAWFVDDWDVYHMGLGEVHCGTNSWRISVDDWWTSALHLLGD